MEAPIRRAVADAVELVNTHAGKAAVHLLFKGEDEIDFIANSARIEGDQFEFASGFESFTGSVGELSRIRAELIS